MVKYYRLSFQIYHYQGILYMRNKRAIYRLPFLYINCRLIYFFLVSTFFVFSTIACAFKPYLFIKSVGFPDSPNSSFTATNSCGVGNSLANNPEMLSPNPPK